MKDWFEIKDEFEVDGSLRDIYVLHICIDAWGEKSSMKNSSLNSCMAIPSERYPIIFIK